MGREPRGTGRGTVRQRLLRFLAKRRAIHKAAAARQLGVGWSTVQHHAKALVRDGRVLEIKYRGLRFLVPSSVPPAQVKRAVVLGVPEHVKALRTVVKHHQFGIQDLATRLQWSRKTTRRCLYALVGAGLLSKSRDYHPRFTPTPAGRTELRRASY